MTMSEEDEQFVRNNLNKVLTSPREIIDEDSRIYRKRVYEESIALEQKQRDKQSLLWKQAAEMEKVKEDNELSKITNGLHRSLKYNQTKFVDSSCPFCDTSVKTPARNWNGFQSKNNGFLHGTYWDASYTDENLNHSRKHECPNNIDVLSAKIVDLQKQLDDYKQFADSYFRHMSKL